MTAALSFWLLTGPRSSYRHIRNEEACRSLHSLRRSPYSTSLWHRELCSSKSRDLSPQDRRRCLSRSRGLPPQDRDLHLQRHRSLDRHRKMQANKCYEKSQLIGNSREGAWDRPRIAESQGRSSTNGAHTSFPSAGPFVLPVPRLLPFFPRFRSHSSQPLCAV